MGITTSRKRTSRPTTSWRPSPSEGATRATACSSSRATATPSSWSTTTSRCSTRTARGVSELKRYDRDAVLERYGIEPAAVSRDRRPRRRDQRQPDRHRQGRREDRRQVDPAVRHPRRSCSRTPTRSRASSGRTCASSRTAPIRNRRLNRLRHRRRAARRSRRPRAPRRSTRPRCASSSTGCSSRPCSTACSRCERSRRQPATAAASRRLHASAAARGAHPGRRRARELAEKHASDPSSPVGLARRYGADGSRRARHLVARRVGLRALGRRAARLRRPRGLARDATPKVLHDAKRAAQGPVAGAGSTSTGIVGDTLLGAWLLRPGRTSVDPRRPHLLLPRRDPPGPDPNQLVPADEAVSPATEAWYVVRLAGA